MTNIDLNKSKSDILQEIHLDWKDKEAFRDLTREQSMKRILHSYPWLECKAADGAKVSPVKCMFCSYGHMTECHFPYTCFEAQCNHYRQNEEY